MPLNRDQISRYTDCGLATGEDVMPLKDWTIGKLNSWMLIYTNRAKVYLDSNNFQKCDDNLCKAQQCLDAIQERLDSIRGKVPQPDPEVMKESLKDFRAGRWQDVNEILETNLWGPGDAEDTSRQEAD